MMPINCISVSVYLVVVVVVFVLISLVVITNELLLLYDDDDIYMDINIHNQSRTRKRAAAADTFNFEQSYYCTRPMAIDTAAASPICWSVGLVSSLVKSSQAKE